MGETVIEDAKPSKRLFMLAYQEMNLTIFMTTRRN